MTNRFFVPFSITVIASFSMWYVAKIFQNATQKAEYQAEQLNQNVERLTELDRMKTQFLANMSHELRTPLSAILGFASLLLYGIGGDLTGEQREDVKAIHNSGQYLLSLINDVLDLAKIQAGKLPLKFGEVNIAQIVCVIKSSAMGLLKDKPDIKFTIEIKDDISVWGDEKRLRQVFLNLVSNAIKFTNSGAIGVLVTEHENKALISVIDTGVGIVPSALERIFEDFTRVDNSSTRPIEGTGLGLPISKRLVELHGGCIEVVSEVGMGSCFTVILPVYQKQKTNQHAPEIQRMTVSDSAPELAHDKSYNIWGENDSCKKYKVLLVDDHAETRHFVGKLVKKLGSEFLETANGIEALLLAPQADLILLDLHMPQMDGYETCRQLRKNKIHVPVLCITADVVKGTREAVLEAGFTSYMTKPLQFPDLVKEIQKHLPEE